MKSTPLSPRFLRDNNAAGDAIGKGVRGAWAARAFKAFALSALLLGAGTAAATAQTGWVVNIDNSGFSPLPAGGQADYKVSIANSDNYLAPASTVVFTIPANTVFTGVSKLSNCSPAAGGAPSATPFAVTCDLPAILPGTSTDFIVGMRHMQAGTTELKASVPTEPGVASFTRKTTVHEGADLSVALTAAPSPLQAGKIVTLTAVVTNQGPHASKNGKVVLTLPTGLSGSGVVMPPNCSIAGNLISCDLGDMAPDQVRNLEFSTQVIAAEASTATASAQVISGTPRDPNNANDSAVAEIEILEGMDVSLRKSRSPAGLLLLGNTATFTLEPLVAGRVPTSATITDSVPANYRILSVDAGSGWECEVTGQDVSCEYTAATGSNYRKPITITTEVVDVGLKVTNTADITAVGENAGGHVNNSANDGAADIVLPKIDMVASKSTPDRGLVTVGNSYDFNLGARNDGNAPLAERLTITDMLPDGLVIESVNAPGWICSPMPVVGPLAMTCYTDKYVANPLWPGQSIEPIVVTAKVTKEGTFNNGMLVSFDGYLTRDPFPGDNTAYSGGLTSANNDKWADLQLKKSVVGAATVLAGEEITFRLEVVNVGPAEAKDVHLFDELRDIVAENGGAPGPISFTPTGGLQCSEKVGSAYSRILSCEIATLAKCESGKDCPYVDVTVRVGSVGVKKNEANVYSLVTPDPETDNNIDDAEYTVTPRTDVTVTKASTAVATGAAVGQELTYVITALVPNNGLSPAQNVVVKDILPDGVRFISATPSAGACTMGLASGEIVPNAAGDNSITCSLGTLANGSQQTITVVVVPTMSVIDQDIENLATVSTTTPEIDSDNNEAKVKVRITKPALDLEIQKKDGPDPVEIGTDTTYVITVINSGPSEATDVTMVDTLPTSGLANPRMVLPLPAGWSCTVNAVPDTPGGNVTCRADRVAVGAPVELRMLMKAVERKRHTNQVELSSAESRAGYDTDTTNNTSNEDTTVRVRADIAVTKTPTTPDGTGVVDLRQEFYWDLDVTALSGDGLDVAEGVVLTDTFPAGMVLTRIPQILQPSANRVCVGGIGDSAITCQLDEIAPSETVTVRVWVKIISIATPGDRVVNTATATTQSFDKNPSNNTDVAGTVTTVKATSISGTVFRDFNKDDKLTAERDTGIAGVSVIVSGTSSHDNAPITMPAVLTDAAGRYTVPNLPPGTYTVTYTAASITEPHLVLGKSVLGSDSTGAGAGQIVDPRTISGVVATTATGGTNYNFTMIPTARIGLAKSASAPVFQADGSYKIDYTLTVKNLSLEPLVGVEITDDFTIANRNFGNYSAAAGTPPEGHYSVSTVSTTLTDAAKPAFTGQPGSQILVSGGRLAAGASATATFTLHINAAVPRLQGLTHTNQAVVSGAGEYSGQTSTDNPQLRDPSNNGTNVDPNNNGIANEPSDNVETVVTPNFAPAIDLKKTAQLTSSGASPDVNDQVTYTFVVTNTGKTPLIDVRITDPLPGLSALSGTIPQPLRLEPNGKATFTATYALKQADLDNDVLNNTATAVGQWGVNGGGVAQTVVRTGQAKVEALAKPGLTIDKSISSSTITDPSVLGQTITYAFLVTNTGNTNLRDVKVVDPLLPGNSALTIGSLPRGTSTTVFATYTIKQADLDRGRVDNTAYATGVYGPTGSPKTTNSATDSETKPVFQYPSVVLTKTIDPASVPSEPRDGAKLTWTVTAFNDGNVTLKTLKLTDPMPGAVITPAQHASVAPGQTVTFKVVAPITQAQINTGEVDNQATLNFETPAGPGTPVQDDETTSLPQVPRLELTKLMISTVDAPLVAGDTLRYRFTIKNTGNLALSNITLDDDLPGFVMDAASAAALATAVLQPQNAANSVPAANRQIVVEGSLVLTQTHIDDGKVDNTATAEGYPTAGPTNVPVTDTDQVTSPLVRAPQIRLVKTILDAPAGAARAGDVVTYGFAIHNTGNVVLNSVVLRELLVGSVIVNPTGWTGPMLPGDINDDAITATYVLTQADIDRGYVENSAEVEGIGLGPTGAPTTVKDISGTAVGNDTVTRLPITAEPELQIVKSIVEKSLSTPPMPGDTIDYQFVVTNTGNLTMRNVRINDPLLSATSLTLIAVLEPGEANAVTFGPVRYSVVQGNIQAGHVTNTATASGEYRNPVTQVDELMSAPSNTIVVPLEQVPGIAVVKEAVAALNDPTTVGEQIEYYFRVTNTGNLTLDGVTVTDPLPGLPQSSFPVGTLLPAQTLTVGPIAYSIVQSDLDRRYVLNQAVATGTYDIGNGPEPITDLSGPTITTDEELVVPMLPIRPVLEIIKQASFVGDTSYALVGDRIDFTFEISNLGNVPVADVRPEEVSFTFGGVPAATPLTDFVPASVTLDLGESQMFTASYVLTQSDLNAGAGMPDGMENIAQAVGVAQGAIPVTSPTDTAVLTLSPQQPSDVVITKTTKRPIIHRGETVPFVIEVRNNALGNAGKVTIVDRIPSGFVFVEGSATVDGVAFVPTVTGNEISFAALPLNALQRIEIGLVLQALPGTPPGRYRNVAFGFDEIGADLGSQGEATVEIVPDAVFDCSDVIGTVFNDLNGNGYQDQDEPGIPGVRLSTARGLLVTTDAFGRYSIPCAALPDSNIGSNFVLKIDTGTLPTGFAMTTDNPAMARLTAGKMVEMNFGAQIGRQIRLSLDNGAFVSGSTAPSVELESGIEQLISILVEQQARLLIVYEAAGDRQVSGPRVSTVVNTIRERWRAVGAPYTLVIDTKIEEW
ncbi:hypothetical protein WH87_03355 [Devosia epidermidihirudinis]|uniref:DUF11 domain-containing protein n=1 Tax=Devosia epidermidihirudinis TaxID=1293439 RepID=A0A0F5QEW6_9HYPH|nr:DUF11 domain-containing protein [Devosia epidermidihirudinis]KKC39276.1 hypothetical protein WH87_03355 [Devosia epidermidihirudinis]